MNAVTDIVKELEEMGSPLAKMPRVTPFNIPENYFSSFTTNIQTIVSEPDPVLDLPRTNPYSLPENYFETFAAGIMDKVAEPVFSKTAAPAFDVPAGYFEDFSAKMLALAKAADQPAAVAPSLTEKKQARTIAFRPQKALRWAAAAVLVLGIGFGSYKVVNTNSKIVAPEVTAEKQLAMLDKSTINSYVQQHIEEFDMELLAETTSLGEEKSEKSIHKLNKNDIRQYLNEADGGDSGIN